MLAPQVRLIMLHTRLAATLVLTLLACITPASAGAGGGVILLPLEPEPRLYELYDADGVGCAGPYGCYDDFVEMELFSLEGRWMASLVHGPWNPVAVFGPLEGSPEEGFSYTSSDIGNEPFWGCIGDVTVHLAVGGLDESTPYDLYVERSGTHIDGPCYFYHLYGTGSATNPLS